MIERYMETSDIIILFGFVIVLFIVVPRLTQLLKPRNASIKTGSRSISTSPTPSGSSISISRDDVQYKEDQLKLPKPAEKADRRPLPEAGMVAHYYEGTQASEYVPSDHCSKPVGQCPDSKPMSTDLPLGNVPMCVAALPGSGDNMRLRFPRPNPVAS